MQYDSQLEAIWAKVSSEGSLRRSTSSRQSFRNVCDAFYQAEECPHSPPVAPDIKAYRAEWNIWAYYFGEGVQFPGRDPALDPASSMITTQEAESAFPNVTVSENNKTSHTSSTTLPSVTTKFDAEQMKTTLQAIWASNPRLKQYEPQLGWNPAIGEPWLSVRCYIRNAFPALVGKNHQYLHALEHQVPEFRLRYERFPTDGYLLIWPEFARPTDLVNQAIWAKFGNFRAFLEGWATSGEKLASGQTQCAPIHHAYRSFKGKKGSAARSVPNPPGFRPDVSRFRDLAHRVTNRRMGGR